MANIITEFQLKLADLKEFQRLIGALKRNIDQLPAEVIEALREFADKPKGSPDVQE